jgi:hypothetical protein
MADPHYKVYEPRLLRSGGFTQPLQYERRGREAKTFATMSAPVAATVMRLAITIVVSRGSAASTTFRRSATSGATALGCWRWAMRANPAPV